MSRAEAIIPVGPRVSCMGCLNRLRPHIQRKTRSVVHAIMMEGRLSPRQGDVVACVTLNRFEDSLARSLDVVPHLRLGFI